MNTCVFSGNLGHDPSTKDVGQHQVTEFSLAVKSGYGDRQSTFWVRCQLWNRAKLAEYLSKGSRVVVSGELNMREFDKKDGSKGYSLELRVNDLDLPPKSSTEPAPASTGGGTAKYGTDPNEVMPF
jgi:single-strand DNA-binding protein